MNRFKCGKHFAEIAHQLKADFAYQKASLFRPIFEALFWYPAVG